MTGDIRKDAVTSAADRTMNVRAPLVTIAVALFLFCLSRSPSIGDSLSIILLTGRLFNSGSVVGLSNTGEDKSSISNSMVQSWSIASTFASLIVLLNDSLLVLRSSTGGPLLLIVTDLPMEPNVNLLLDVSEETGLRPGSAKLLLLGGLVTLSLSSPRLFLLQWLPRLLNISRSCFQVSRQLTGGQG